MENVQIDLSVKEMPQRWYNILPDLPEPLPEPQGDLSILSETMIAYCLGQEFSTQRWHDIPEEVLMLLLKAGRPRPLFIANRLKEVLGTPATLIYKAEFYSPTGSHKVNTALAQAYYAKKEGFKRGVTETGAGQWGSAWAYAVRMVGLEQGTIYWVKNVHDWKEARRNLMTLYLGETEGKVGVFASPSKRTKTGRAELKKDSKHPGSLGIAISEGLEDARKDQDAVYVLGSVLNHVLLHQTIIGLETKEQLKKIEKYPDIMISCVGGGSNFGGLILPFMGDMLRGAKPIRFIAAQSEAAPNLIKGEYRYDYADHAGLTPQLKMYTLGHQAKMPPIKADGLRYHAAAPILSLLRHKGLIEAVAYPIDEKHVFECAKLFVQTEGFLPAPESAYSIACAIDEAIKCKEAGEEKVIVFNISGHGFMDMQGYKEVLGLK